MLFDIEVKISLKSGMLNPEATTIERSLDLLGYEVKNVKTGEVSNVEADGAFIYIGLDPITDMIKELEITDESGYVTVDHSMINELMAAGTFKESDRARYESCVTRCIMGDGLSFFASAYPSS